MTRSATLCVEVVFALQDKVQRLQLTINAGTQARELVKLAANEGMDFQAVGLCVETAPLGVYSLRVADDYVMCDEDRLEIYRPLQQDPMDLRRRRARLSSK